MANKVACYDTLPSSVWNFYFNKIIINILNLFKEILVLISHFWREKTLHSKLVLSLREPIIFSEHPFELQVNVFPANY